MPGKATVRSDEGLMMMQELDDRLKEHIDKLEHIRFSTTELKDNLSGSTDELNQSIENHVDWLHQLSERLENIQMNTNVFVQTNPKARMWGRKQRSRQDGSVWPRLHLADDAQSDNGWNSILTRRNSDAASEMSCAW